MTADETPTIELVDTGIRPGPSREYEFTADATATIDGPAGRLRLRRRYGALPRHNDVVDPGAIDSNDELVGRPDAVHVHTTFHAVDGGAEDYFLDAHETWRPADPSVLSDRAAFLAACREHHLANAERAYARAMEERGRDG